MHLPGGVRANAMLDLAKFHFDNHYFDQPKKLGPFWLYQVGDLCCSERSPVGPHRQRVYELSYIVSGTGLFRAADTEYPVGCDDLVFNTVGETHAIASSPCDPLRFFYLGFTFNQEDARYPKGADLERFFQAPPARVLHHPPEIKDCFLRLFSELLSTDPLSALLLETYVTQILFNAYRYGVKEKLPSYQRQNARTSKEQLVYELIHYVDTHIASMHGLEDLSAEFGYSASYLGHVFSSVMSESLQVFCRRKKFEKAIELLWQGEAVTEVAERLGYRSIHSFSRAFRAFYGRPPSSCKKREENKETS